MKKLHKLLLISFIPPFFVTLFIATSILIFQFVWKYIDEIIGKGIAWSIIMELLGWAGAGMFPLALPIAVLLAGVMMYGSLAEHSEFIALKSLGISYWQTARFMLVVGFILALSLALYSHFILPHANFRFYSLLYDIRQAKPILAIPEGIFYRKLRGFFILVKKKDDVTNYMEDITIYQFDAHNPPGPLLKARSGTLESINQGDFLKMTFHNGAQYLDVPNKHTKKHSQRSYKPFAVTKFSKWIKYFDLREFKFRKQSAEMLRGHYEMLDLSQLLYVADSLEQRIMNMPRKALRKPYQAFFSFMDSAFMQKINTSTEAPFPEPSYSLLVKALTNASSVQHEVLSIKRYQEGLMTIRNRFLVSFHKRLSLSFAVLLLLVLGTSLGALIRRGGLGAPLIASGITFVIFYLIFSTGERLAHESALPVFLGLWLPNLIFLPITVMLVWLINNDYISLAKGRK
ncbi:MAG: YjgP/YjgQ family permease [Chlorobi bacterium]|nr:YjgP/YjgQ family permease [Chlorobiota bacterium]